MLVYNIELPDGALKRYTTNVISINVLSQVKFNGDHYKTLDGIVDYKRNEFY